MQNNEYRIPFKNKMRVVQRGMWEGRLDPYTGRQAVDLNDLAREVTFIAVACAHDDELTSSTITGYSLCLEDGTYLEHNFPEEQRLTLSSPTPTLKSPKTISLVDESSTVIAFDIEKERDGDLVLYRR
jgi:hypothetical protein